MVESTDRESSFFPGMKWLAYPDNVPIRTGYEWVTEESCGRKIVLIQTLHLPPAPR